MRSILPAVCAAAVVLSGCHGGTDQAQNTAIELAESFFDALKRGSLDECMSMYDPRVFEGTPKSKWLSTRQEWAQTLGAYESHQIQSAQVREPLVGVAVTRTVVLTYRVRYTKRDTFEVFSIEVGSPSARPRILSHDVRWDPSAPERGQ